MNTEEIKKLLKNYNEEQVNVFCKYCEYLEAQKNKDKTNSLKNPWMQKRTPEYLATCFKKVAIDGLVFDGVHITLQSTGISYDYIAYKNKMFLVYPESIIDVGLVYQDDKFKFEKKSGVVCYVHEIGNPFEQTEQNIIGGYCVVKNKRGEFLTLLSKADIDKHRKIARTDYIWKNWFMEMALKTLIKKACKQHFADVFQNIETIDNDNYDLDLLEIKPEKPITEEQSKHLTEFAVEVDADYDKFCKYFGIDDIDNLPASKYKSALAMLEKKKAANASN